MTRPRSPPPSTELKDGNKRPAIVCDFFAKGWCIKGKSCRFLHIRDATSKQLLGAEADSNQKTPQQTNEGDTFDLMDLKNLLYTILITISNLLLYQVLEAVLKNHGLVVFLMSHHLLQSMHHICWEKVFHKNLAKAHGGMMNLKIYIHSKMTIRILPLRMLEERSHEKTGT